MILVFTVAKYVHKVAIMASANTEDSLTIFLTGGSGLLGTQILKRLVQSGHRVQALARSAASIQKVRDLGATPVSGDLETVSEVGLRGIDVVIHAAAPVVFWGPWAMYQKEIVDATLALYRSAAQQGVKRFIYISSESVMQGREDLVDVDATQPYAEPPNSDYGRAKKAAEEALLNALRTSPSCELIVLRPTFIWSGDAPAVQMLRKKILQRSFMWIDRGERPFEAVHVDNVALAVECALNRGVSGCIYLVTDNSPYTSRSLLTGLLQNGPDAVNVPSASIPAGLARALAACVEGIWRALGIWRTAPPISKFDVAFLAQSRRYRIDTTTQDLGYQPVTRSATRDWARQVWSGNSR